MLFFVVCLFVAGCSVHVTVPGLTSLFLITLAWLIQFWHNVECDSHQPLLARTDSSSEDSFSSETASETGGASDPESD